MLRRSHSFVNVKTKETKTRRTPTDDGGGGGGGGSVWPTPSNSTSAGGSLGRLEAVKYYRGPKTPTTRLQSLFNPFSKVQDHLDQLNSILHEYTLHGLPRIPDSYTRGRPHYDHKLLLLEDNWTDVVSNHVTLNKRQKDQQEAIWELLTTEVEYIHKLRVLIDVFFCCLVNLQSEHILCEIETKKVFCNIVEVYYATCHFWANHLSQVLRIARETKEPFNPSLLKSGFLVFDKIFEPYTKYCIEHESCLDYIRGRTKDNNLFRTFILWGETQKQCNRLKLVDLIVKPWQRLTKYKLLLYAMRRPLEKMDASSLSSSSSHDQQEQMKDITEAIEQVEKFVNYLNMTMRRRHDTQQVSNVIERIDTYDALDSLNEECDKLVSEYCRVDSVLSCPVPGCSQQELRILLLEGNLKLKDANSKIDAYCFLFTDLLLVAKPAAKRGDKVRVIKPPMRLDKIVVYGLKDNSSFLLLYLNEYQMAQSAYTFHGDSKLWIDNITKAQNEYREKRSLHMTLSESLILNMYDDGDDDYPPSSSERPSSAEPNVPNESYQSKSALHRSLSFINLANDEEVHASRPSLGVLASNQKRSKSQNFLPACSLSRLDDQGDPVAEVDVRSNYLSIPKALASVSGMFRDAPLQDDDQKATMSSEAKPPSTGDSHKTRLNQRRLIRGERRYHTADTIQDLKTAKKQSTLHKHRSWNCAGDGMTSAAAIRSSWPSSTPMDSMQSFYSSSGISSSGSSIRMSCDNDICEETENELLLEDTDDTREAEDDEDDDDDELGTTGGGVEEDVLLSSERYIKVNSIGTQTPPDIRDISSSSYNASPSLRFRHQGHSRSMPNIYGTDLCQGHDDDESASNDIWLTTTKNRSQVKSKSISSTEQTRLRSNRQHWTSRMKTSKT